MHRAAPALRHPRRLACLALTMTLWPWGAALAQGPAPRVYTRAVVRELPAVGAQPALLRLKIVPQGKLPFSTLTFRVQDRRLLNGIDLATKSASSPNGGPRATPSSRCARWRPACGFRLARPSSIESVAII